MPKNLAIIPARGGSKRIKLKNLHPIVGKPLINYTIEACQNSSFIDEIVVTTDSEIIAKHSSELGCKIHQRDHTLAQEITGNELEITKKQILETYRDQGFERYLFLLPPYIFRSVFDIDHAIQCLNHSKYVRSFVSHRLDHCYDGNENGYKRLKIDNQLIQFNSYISGGWLNPPDLQRYKLIELNWVRQIDIDTPFDVAQAEYVINNGLFNFSTGKTINIGQ